MFGEALAEYVAWSPAALHDEIARLELAARALDARRLAARAAAEARQTPALDGHKSTQAYLRATCNQPSYVARAEVTAAAMSASRKPRPWWPMMVLPNASRSLA